jgi:branched-chain amino acid transport system ATP-binding protein
VPLLETREVTVRFGGNVAVDNVSIGVDPGTVTGLIGPNGAGKTTLFNVITGLQKPARGEVLLDGVDITGYPPYKRAQLGLARTFQRLELFLSLSVRDNIRVAGDVRNASRSGRIDVASETDRILELTGLTDVAGRDVSDIPTGRARVVEVARALMTQPSVVLLDEPASGQTEHETAAFGQLLRRLAGDGLAICLVEHDVGLVMQVCSTITVLDYGAVIARGSAEQIRDDPAVIDAYLGTPEGLGPTEGAA